MKRQLRLLNGSSTPPADDMARHLLINLVQGRMLEYLADSICGEFQISELFARNRILTALTIILSDEFFALFREKINAHPALVIHIAKRIVRKEEGEASGQSASKAQNIRDRLFPALFRKYFEYRNLNTLLGMLESDADIQRTILEQHLQHKMGDCTARRKVLKILAEDSEGICPTVFMGYLREKGTQELDKALHSGSWKRQRDNIRRQLAHLRGE